MASHFTEHDLERWTESGLISDEQRRAILADLQAHPPDEGLSVANLLYYGGGLLVLVAYSIFLGFQWESLNQGGRVVIAAFSLAFFAVISFVLLRNERFRLPGELLQVVAVAVVPLLAFAVLDAVGLWPDDPGYRASTSEVHQYQKDIAWNNLAIALATLVAAAAAFRLSRSPYVLVGGLVALTWLVVDASLLVDTNRGNFDFETTQLLLIASMGALSLAAGVAVRDRPERDYSLWVYVAGLAGLTFGLGGKALSSDTEGWAILFLIVSLAIVALSIPLQQRLFAAAGFAGVFVYLARLVFEVFESAGAALALVVLGLFVLAAGAVYQRLTGHLYDQGTA